MTNFTREINRLLIGLMIAFGVVIVAATYYAIVGQFTLLPREDNPRLIEAEQSVKRGAIYDRDRELIVRTVIDRQGFAQRKTLYPATASATGYYSYRYGASGAEAAYDTLLSGVNQQPTFTQMLLDQPRQGADIRLTFNLEVQQAVVNAMGDRAGAAIVMTVPGGELLALASQPTYDPNTLDEQWDQLVASPNKPFFNRALQGQYQPGTLLQLPVLVTAMVEGQPLSGAFPGGALPVMLDDLTLSCIQPPPESEITLRQAYLYGCPAPFAQIGPALGVAPLQRTLDLMRLTVPPRLDGFLAESPTTPDTPSLTRTNLQENILGQGDIQVSPLSIAAMTAAVINDGNAPQAQTLLAIREPRANEWQAVTQPSATYAYMTTQHARRMSEIMRESATVGTGRTGAWADLDVGGQAAITYSGEGTQVWFTGFAILENKQNVVITVVLEDTTDPDAAVRVAQHAIEAADMAIPMVEPTPGPAS